LSSNRVIGLNEKFTGSHYKSFRFVRKTVYTYTYIHIYISINKMMCSLYTNSPIFIHTRFQTSFISYCRENRNRFRAGRCRGGRITRPHRIPRFKYSRFSYYSDREREREINIIHIHVFSRPSWLIGLNSTSCGLHFGRFALINHIG